MEPRTAASVRTLWRPMPARLARYVRDACEDGDTILGKGDLVVIVRRWRRRGPVQRPGVWAPVGVVDSQELAEAMAAVVCEEIGTEARVVTGDELLHKFGTEDRERILDQLNGRTTADIKRDLELRWTAAGRLASRHERRTGLDRRSGGDRRSDLDQSLAEYDRRSGHDRRSGRERRRVRSSA